jgi:ResB-like family
MSNTMIEQKPVPAAKKPAAGRPKGGLGHRAFQFFSSLRLTVVFLLLGVILVFVGTIAQVDEGLYGAQNRYFRSLIIWWQPNGAAWKLPVFPGGYFVGGVLLVNLVLAYARRFEFSKKKIGLLTIHSGLVLLLLGQFATDLLSIESAMNLTEGESKAYSEDFRANELVLIDKSDPAKDMVYSIPDSIVKRSSDIRDPKLPFALRVKKQWVNAGLVEPKGSNPPMAIKSGASDGLLQDILVIPTPPVTSTDGRNMPAAVIEVLNGDKSVGSFLVSTMINRPETFTVNGKEWEIGMRFTRYYYPFSLTLLKATHEKYKGTEIPKNFASRVRVENPSKNEARETVIYMNNPLRYSGLTFFQFQMGADEMALREGQRPTSTFQVVKNPSWVTPYLACVMISLGLIYQFGYHLIGFVRRRTA